MWIPSLSGGGEQSGIEKGGRKGLLCSGSHLDLVRIMQVKEDRQEVNRSNFNSGLYHLILSKHLLISRGRISEHTFHSPVCAFVKKQSILGLQRKQWEQIWWDIYLTFHISLILRLLLFEVSSTNVESNASTLSRWRSAWIS